MTASTITTIPSSSVAGSDRALAGVRPLMRKELADWRHGMRVWVILGVSAVFMGLAAANSWINAWVLANLPADAAAPDGRMSMVPLDNVLAAASSQIFVLAAIFATMSLLVGERERGTLAWIASKPIARPAIWTAKWVVGAAVVSLAAVIVPLVITVAVVTGLYGAPAVMPVIALAIGMVATVTFFVAVALAASTVVGNQAAVAAIGFAAFLLPTIVTAIIPFDIAPFLPTSILDWTVGLASGAPVGIVTPVAWIVSIAVLGVIAARRMEAMEL